MRRMISATLILILLISYCMGASSEEGIIASTPVSGADSEQLHNIELAAQNLDGVIIPSGAGFSFNANTIPREDGAAYSRARDGAGVYAPDGGLDQVATTLWLAIMQLGSDIRIDEKHSYGADFIGSYVPDGDIAILIDAAGNDLRFTNLGGGLRIHMYLAEDKLCCELSSTTTTAGGSTRGSGQSRHRNLVASTSITLVGSPTLISNVTLAANSINDTVLLSGDLFSFNDTVGPRSELYGYQSAINGRGVNVTGGGVAQVASALWLAIKGIDGIAIVEKSTYGGRYNQHYVENSNDAILTDFEGNIDFSFRNSGARPLTIVTYVQEGVLCCEIYRD